MHAMIIAKYLGLEFFKIQGSINSQLLVQLDPLSVWLNLLSNFRNSRFNIIPAFLVVKRN